MGAKLRIGYFFAFVFIGALLSCAPKEQKVDNKQDQRPNIVFIMADDLGWADLPVYGNQFNEAPNLDKLRSEGMLFTNAYAAAPVCSDLVSMTS